MKIHKATLCLIIIINCPQREKFFILKEKEKQKKSISGRTGFAL